MNLILKGSVSGAFTNSAPIDIIVNPEFGTVEEAKEEARRYARALGQLSLVFRHAIRQLGLHEDTLRRDDYVQTLI